MTKEIIQNQEWYEALIDDLKAILTEGIWNYRWTLIQTYHLFGRRVLEEKKHFKQVYGKKIVSQVSQSLGQSERTIWRAIQFAEKFPNLDKLPEGKNISWHKICNLYLPKADKHEHEWQRVEAWQCKKCPAFRKTKP